MIIQNPNYLPRYSRKTLTNGNSELSGLVEVVIVNLSSAIFNILSISRALVPPPTKEREINQDEEFYLCCLTRSRVLIKGGKAGAIAIKPVGLARD